MPYQAVAIANEFIALARQAKKPITPMKLQKLVYFAHGWYLALAGKPLINEPVEAWKFGPVIPSLYHVLKQHGNSNVGNCVTDVDLWGVPLCSSELHEFSIDDGPNEEENESVKRLVKKIWEVYGGFTAVQLSNLTHLSGSPWDITPDRDKKHVVIDQNVIQNYFRSQVRQNNNA